MRFAEDEEGQPDGHPGAAGIGTLYVQEFAHVQLGKPEKLVASVEPR